MAIMECSNGHLYDVDLYTVCPYCNGNNNYIRFDTGGFDNGEGRTAAPGDFGRTTAPSDVGRTPVSDFGAASIPAGNEQLGKTIAPEGYRKSVEQQQKTTAVFKKHHGLEPVVGWLVCIDGPNKGKDYHLWAKINSIGRSESNDVCIEGDVTISKELHARLAYDSRHNNFQLIPGTSTNNIYLNDEPIYIPTAIKAYDEIELGDSKMLFVPLCCERFQWDTDKK